MPGLIFFLQIVNHLFSSLFRCPEYELTIAKVFECYIVAKEDHISSMSLDVSLRLGPPWRPKQTTCQGVTHIKTRGPHEERINPIKPFYNCKLKLFQSNVTLLTAWYCLGLTIQIIFSLTYKFTSIWWIGPRFLRFLITFYSIFAQCAFFLFLFVGPFNWIIMLLLFFIFKFGTPFNLFPALICIT